MRMHFYYSYSLNDIWLKIDQMVQFITGRREHTFNHYISCIERIGG